MTNIRQIISNEDELIDFFRDLPPEARCEFGGFHFDIYQRRDGRGLLGAAIGGMLGAALAANRGFAFGDFAKVWLPVSFGVDLLVKPRPMRVETEDEFEASFEVSASSLDLARRRLTAPITTQLLQLNEKYGVVEMRDDFVAFGPLLSVPANNATNLAGLIEAVATLVVDPGEDGAAGDGEFDPDAPFCHFCGSAVPENANLCPHCGENLLTDSGA
jgi:hypothetical protein